MASVASEVNNVNQPIDTLTVYATEKKMIHLKGMRACASKSKEY